MAIFDHGFVATISVIIISELGDKTFFIAAIMSMTHSRVTVFLAAITALIGMTLLSVFLGLSTSIIPRTVTHFISIALFAIFGLKMLYDAKYMSGEEAKEEYEEVQKSLHSKRGKSGNPSESTARLIPEVVKTSSPNHKPLNISENNVDIESFTLDGGDSMKAPEDEELMTTSSNGVVNMDEVPLVRWTTEDPETGVLRTVTTVNFGTRVKRWLMRFISLAFIETLTMTFVAEWGDRSQIATIILAAREDPFAVTLGAIIGHAICSFIAVIAGRFVAQMISARTVTIIGGIIFVTFAVWALVTGED